MIATGCKQEVKMATIQMINQIILWERRLEIENNKRNLLLDKSSSLILPRLGFLQQFQNNLKGKRATKFRNDHAGCSCCRSEELQEQYLN